MRELQDLRNLADSMLNSIDTLKDISQLQESTRKLLADLPTFWPVQGHIRLTNYFGFAEHPVTKLTYLHKGIDIAKSPGVPVYAAANGKVLEKKFDKNGFGNYIIVRHKAGFYTKYGHLQEVSVKKAIQWFKDSRSQAWAIPAYPQGITFTSRFVWDLKYETH